MLQKVATTGVDLDNVYDQTLRRIKEQKGGRSRLGVEVLMWVSHAERPLRIDELCIALAVEVETAELDLENIRPQDTILGSCLGLAVVDRKTSTVRLIHYTLQEYLSRPGILPGAHRILGETCLTYLNYDQVKRLSVNNHLNLRDTPFLEYSSLHWVNHAKMELSDHAKSLALKLLTRFDCHISSALLFNKIHNTHVPQFSRSRLNGLQCASYFGIDEVVAALIEMECYDINQGDEWGFTPLIWAARQGNLGVVKLLLTCGDVNPDKPGGDCGTPLYWASQKGHEGVVRLLLARDDVNPDKPGSGDQTPLHWASRKGHEGVVGLLLARDDVNPDKPGSGGETPLHWASANRHGGGVVGLLLARYDVNPNQPDICGQTPLLWASWHGNEEVVRLLLTRDDVNPDKPDNDGKTPLYWASRNGHDAVVRLLLARNNANPYKSDNDS